jgi:hypothetical protein
LESRVQEKSKSKIADKKLVRVILRFWKITAILIKVPEMTPNNIASPQNLSKT